MTNTIEPSVENLMLEIKKRAREELIASQAAFEELVDDLIQEKIEWGEISDEDDNDTLREDLVGRWEEVEEYLRKNEIDNP